MQCNHLCIIYTPDTLLKLTRLLGHAFTSCGTWRAASWVRQAAGPLPDHHEFLFLAQPWYLCQVLTTIVYRRQHVIRCARMLLCRHWWGNFTPLYLETTNLKVKNYGMLAKNYFLIKIHFISKKFFWISNQNKKSIYLIYKNPIFNYVFD